MLLLSTCVYSETGLLVAVNAELQGTPFQPNILNKKYALTN